MKPVASDYDHTYDHMTPEQKQGIDFIITGENYDKYGKLYDDGVRIPVFWNPDKEDLMPIVLHKANIINKTEARVFYEDQSIQANLLRALCKNCKIVLYGGAR